MWLAGYAKSIHQLVPWQSGDYMPLIETGAMPFLLESDIISLSKEFMLVNDELVDRVLDGRHQLSGRAVSAVRLLKGDIDFGAWADYCRLSRQEIDLLAGFLNAIGALQVRRSMRGRIKATGIVLGMLVHGQLLGGSVYRKQASFMTVAVAVARGAKWLVLSWPVLILLVSGASTVNLGSFSLISGLSLAIFLISLFVHEAGHMVLLVDNGVDCSIVQQGMRIGILHAPQPLRQEALSALVCPLGGILTAVSLGIICQALFGGAFLTIGIMMGGLHALSWLPWYGDGLTLLTFWKRRLG
jgi:hypothetical protein